MSSPSHRPAHVPDQRPARPHARASLGSVAELAHRVTMGSSRSALISVAGQGAELTIGTWPVPVSVDHPADPLVGFLAPPAWTAVGLSTAGRIRPLGDDGLVLEHAPAQPGRATVLADRAGQVASVLEAPGQPVQTLSEAPSGWVADVLARVLGRATPPPTDRLARWVEVAWLDAVATVVFAHPGAIDAWDQLAHLHPLHPPGPALPPALLSVETEAIELESSWPRIRHLCHRAPAPGATARPPGGVAVPWEDWFDDGSFSRWVQRNQPPAEAIYRTVLDALPGELGVQLADALVTIELG